MLNIENRQNKIITVSQYGKFGKVDIEEVRKDFTYGVNDILSTKGYEISTLNKLLQDTLFKLDIEIVKLKEEFRRLRSEEIKFDKRGFQAKRDDIKKLQDEIVNIAKIETFKGIKSIDMIAICYKQIKCETCILNCDLCSKVIGFKVEDLNCRELDEIITDYYKEI